MKTHRMTPAVPVIEISYHAHAPRARRPHREGHAGHAVEDGRVRAELLVGVVVCALGQEMPIEIAQQRLETVGIVDLGDVAVPRHLEPVGKPVGPVGQHGFEEPHGMEPLHRGRWCVGWARCGRRPRRARSRAPPRPRRPVSARGAVRARRRGHHAYLRRPRGSRPRPASCADTERAARYPCCDSTRRSNEFAEFDRIQLGESTRVTPCAGRAWHRG